MYCLHLEGQRATSIRGVIVTCNMLQDAVYRVDRQKPDCMRSEREFCYLLLISQSCLIDTPRRPTYMISVSKTANWTFGFVRSEDVICSTAHPHARTCTVTYSILHSLFHFVHSIGQPDTPFFSVRRTRRLTIFQQPRLRLK